MLFAGGNVGPNGFGVALHGLGRDLDTSRQAELFPTLLEAAFRADQGHHPVHAGRTLRASHVQFAIPRTAALLAIRADIISTFKLDRPQSRE